MRFQQLVAEVAFGKGEGYPSPFQQCKPFVQMYDMISWCSVVGDGVINADLGELPHEIG